MYKSHGSLVGGTFIHPNYTFLCTMDAFRALLSRTCSPMAVAPDPEAQLQEIPAPPSQDCAWSTIPVPVPRPILGLNRGSVLSRHDDSPTPSLLPCPDDTPPAYTYPPPIPPVSGGDLSEFAANRTVDRHHLFATVIAVILTVALLATAVFFSFFNHGKV